MGKKRIYLEYRYFKEDHWSVYDWTTVIAWADTQYLRMMQDHPGAEFRRVKR